MGKWKEKVLEKYSHQFIKCHSLIIISFYHLPCYNTKPAFPTLFKINIVIFSAENR